MNKELIVTVEFGMLEEQECSQEQESKNILLFSLTIL